MKYQFSVRTSKSGDKNSAATKAILDCNALFSMRGYKDYNLVFSENENRFNYYLSLFKALLKFYFAIEKNSIVAVQYPMLNNVFKYFIKAAKSKNVQFFCIIHDIESLRLGGTNTNEVNKEIKNLNYYDCLIVHNSKMLCWLKNNGITHKMIPLMIFDYLLKDSTTKTNNTIFSNTVCFAGNLTKSSFIYKLNEINNWKFNLYGPNFQSEKVRGSNIKFSGEFSPEQVAYELRGDFGLIWDGVDIDKCDEILGNYLLYNNPHKFSLYLAAGLPVIAPADSAIAQMIGENNIGILINNLHDLKNLQINDANYKTMQKNCLKISGNIRKGHYFVKALEETEKEFKN